MNSAAVGFQCPECVKEGARTTRAGSLPYGGARVVNPQIATIGLIVANVAVWLAIVANGGYSSKLLEKLALIPSGHCGAGNGGYYLGVDTARACGPTWVDGVASGAPWQLVTSMFTHVEWWHIGVNMLSLFFIGPQLELILGRVRYLALYFVSGIAGSAAVMLFSEPHGMTYGASGAIFGLMGALIVIGYKLGAQMQQIWMWLGINLVITFTVSNISWQGHLGGLVGGALAAAALVYAPRERRTPVQFAALGGIFVVSIVLILVRSAALS